MRLRTLALLIVVSTAGCHPLPRGGTTGADADALARAMERAVHKDEWDRTGAVRWTFRAVGQTHRLAWDKQRNLAQVSWRNHLVHLDVANKSGRAWTKGVEQTGKKHDELIEDALKIFFNDSFWLNPVAKLFDDGVTRQKVLVKGKPALFIKYNSGGVTPGDRYLWLLDENARPVAWRMWVKVLELPGLQVSWEDWRSLPSGAMVATKHRFLRTTGVRIADVQAAPSWAELPATDGQSSSR